MTASSSLLPTQVPQNTQLLAVVRKHLDVLTAENLTADHPGHVMLAGDGKRKYSNRSSKLTTTLQ